VKNRRVSSLRAVWARSTHMAARLQASSALDMVTTPAFAHTKNDGENGSALAPATSYRCHGRECHFPGDRTRADCLPGANVIRSQLLSRGRCDDLSTGHAEGIRPWQRRAVGGCETASSHAKARNYSGGARWAPLLFARASLKREREALPLSARSSSTIGIARCLGCACPILRLRPRKRLAASVRTAVAARCVRTSESDHWLSAGQPSIA
jgi:hypothetical protein